jgi:hypothetical protein
MNYLPGLASNPELFLIFASHVARIKSVSYQHLAKLFLLKIQILCIIVL